MGSRSVFKPGRESRRSLAAKQRSSLAGRGRLLRVECLEVRRLLSVSPFPLLTPTQVRAAYGVNLINYGSTPGNGAGQTIAIIDPGDDSAIASDLVSFDALYGLPAPPSFTVVGETGARARPTTPSLFPVLRNRARP